MKRMLINATQPEELRVALVDGQRLYDLDIEAPGREQKKANIYKGKISRVEPSLEAAFVDYGAERHGFLPLKEISPAYYSDPNKTRGSIKELVKEGQEVIVQIEKEERGQKGAALTTYISLAGCFVVLMPNNPRAGGISRRIEGDDRSELRDALQSVDVPEGMGIIIRTAGVGRSPEELPWDLDVLQTQWKAIEQAAASRPAPFLIYAESDVLIRAVRDYLKADIGEIIVDEPNAYARVRQHIELVRPDFLNRVKLYKDDIPLFNRYQVESQIESAFQREVRLPSGGSIVIDRTEAMVCVDVNSSRATKGGDIEETALQTNIEAAEEVARQLRLRDLGGLIVIDFIDMTPAKNQRALEDALRDAVESDRARIQLGRLSKFGLMEMSRQRLRPSLGESNTHVCPRCNGVGTIRNIESMSLSVLRLIEEEAMKDSTAQIHAILPVDAASYLLNEKRQAILDIEKRQEVHIVVVPTPYLETPNFEVRSLRASEEMTGTSYSLAEKPKVEVAEVTSNKTRAAEAAAVQFTPQMAAPPPAPKPREEAKPAAAQAEEKPGLFKRLWSFLFGSEETESKPKHGRDRKGRGEQRGERRGRNDRNDRRRRRDRNERGDRTEREPRQDAKPQQQERKAADKAEQSERQPRDDKQRKGREEGRRGRRRDRGDRPERGERQERVEARSEQEAPQTEPKEKLPPRPPRQSRAERAAQRDSGQAAAVTAPAPVVETHPTPAPQIESSEETVELVDSNNIEAREQKRGRERRRRLPRHLGGRRRDREGDEGEESVESAEVVAENDVETVNEPAAAVAEPQPKPVEATEAATVAATKAESVPAPVEPTPAVKAEAEPVATEQTPVEPVKAPEPAVAEATISTSTEAAAAPVSQPTAEPSATTAALSNAETSRERKSASAPAARPKAIEPLKKSEVSEEEALRNVAELLASLIEPAKNQSTVLHRTPSSSSSPMAKPRVVSAAPAKPASPSQSELPLSSIERAQQQEEKQPDNNS